MKYRYSFGAGLVIGAIIMFFIMRGRCPQCPETGDIIRPADTSSHVSTHISPPVDSQVVLTEEELTAAIEGQPHEQPGEDSGITVLDDADTIQPVAVDVGIDFKRCCDSLGVRRIDTLLFGDEFLEGYVTTSVIGRHERSDIFFKHNRPEVRMPEIKNRLHLYGRAAFLIGPEPIFLLGGMAGKKHLFGLDMGWQGKEKYFGGSAMLRVF